MDSTALDVLLETLAIFQARHVPVCIAKCHKAVRRLMRKGGIDPYARPTEMRSWMNSLWHTRISAIVTPFGTACSLSKVLH